MINAYVKDSDGTYLAMYAEHYSVRQDAVWSKRKRRFLKPNAKGQVSLSANGITRCISIKKLWEDSVEAQQSQVVTKFTNDGNKDVWLNEYHWRIPAQLDFSFDDKREYRPIVAERFNSEQIHNQFRKLLDRSQKKLQSSSRELQLPSYVTFYNWSRKYEDALTTLLEDYSVYRYLLEPAPLDHVRILETQKTWLSLFNSGSIMVRKAGGSIKSLRPNGTGSYQSGMLRNNRLIFGETEGLISGPFKPLLAWVFLGKPQDGQVLFNMTGNDYDFSIHNYRWVDAVKVPAYKHIRWRLIMRWNYEVG